MTKYLTIVGVKFTREQITADPDAVLFYAGCYNDNGDEVVFGREAVTKQLGFFNLYVDDFEPIAFAEYDDAQTVLTERDFGSDFHTIDAE